MKLQRYSNIYLLLSLFCIIAAVSAQVTSNENDSIDTTTDNIGNNGNDRGNYTTNKELYNELIKELDNARKCLNGTKIIRIVAVNFVQVLNIFFSIMPPIFTHRILPYMYYIINFLIKLLPILNYWIRNYGHLVQMY